MLVTEIRQKKGPASVNRRASVVQSRIRRVRCLDYRALEWGMARADVKSPAEVKKLLRELVAS
jgi:hypothetical protein